MVEQAAAVVIILCFLFQNGVTAKEVINAKNNFPHLVRLIDADEGIPDQFFIAVEQELLVKCRNISDALLTLISVHFIFNIEYNPKIHDIMCFIQEHVVGLCFDGRKSAQYLSFTSAIDCY